jgi:hypothetical protein
VRDELFLVVDQFGPGADRVGPEAEAAVDGADGGC